MDTEIDEIADGLFRLSTHVAAADFTFNQFLLRAAEPLLFHTGPRALFPLVSAALTRLMPLAQLRWISFSHFEADECGAMNEFLAAAPQARVAQGEIGCMVSLNDQASRPPLALADGAVLDLGDRSLRFLATPHVPHGWDAGLMFDERSETLLCSDLFTRTGRSPALSEADPVGPALAAEDRFLATALTPQTAPTLRRLATLRPRLLALMHGPAYGGDCAGALQALADGYETRLQAALAAVAVPG